MIKNGSTPTMYYTCTDYLGSINALVTETGTIAEEYNYDAWGKHRNPTDWTYENVSTPTLIYRGYTGHEHLPAFGLVNMNARLYDPVLGRMLSPDNYVQDATSTQNFNRYSYAFNNPARYSDPDGNFIVEAILISGMINLALNMMNGNVKKMASWEALGYFAVGAAAGAAGYGLGSMVGGAIGFNGGAISGGFGGFASLIIIIPSGVTLY
jgi:RHS repeat-associated protein